MRAGILVLFAILIAEPASAQWSTNCSTIGGYTNCRTNGPPQNQQSSPWETLNSSHLDLNAILRARQAQQQMQAAREADLARAQEAARAVDDQIAQGKEDERRMTMRKHAGALINQGKCDEALSYMLENGELGMASEVKLLCAQ